MSLIRKFLARIRPKPPAESPRIETPWGPVSEAARKQAALNMRDDPGLRLKVTGLIADQCGSWAQAEMEMRRRYPEIYEDA